MSTKDEVAATTEVVSGRILCPLEVRGELLRLLFAHALERLQAETAAELDALLPAILDKAFKGEL
jgi:hypothetical protein